MSRPLSSPLALLVASQAGFVFLRGCRTVDVGESVRSALQLPDRSRRHSDESGRLAPSGAMSAFDRLNRLNRPDRFGDLGGSCTDTVFLGGRWTVDSGLSGQPAPERAAVSDRSGPWDDSDVSGRLAPRGAMSASDPSGHSSYEADVPA